MEIAYLADHADSIPRLARWSYKEWSYLHPERSINDVEELMLQRSNKARLPLCLVAVEDGSVIGMVALKTRDLESRPNLGPWLAGLYVEEMHRNRGVGTALVGAVEMAAMKLRITKLYLYTPGQELFYSRIGWKIREHTEWNGHPVTVMEKEFVL